MKSISYTLERLDTPTFHGWIVLEGSEGYEEEIFSSTSLEEALTFLYEMTT